MKWEHLQIENFLSIESAEVTLNDRGLLLIEGINETNEAFKSNGSGKSSLLDAIVYALFDTTSKGIKADDVINLVHGKGTAVILQGSKDGNTYRVERYRKHSKHKNKVRFFINDKDVSEKSAKDTNVAIQKAVGIDYTTFINSIMFSQGNGAGRFALATDKEKKEILENLINLDIYAVAQEVAKDRVRHTENQIEGHRREIETQKIYLDNVAKLEQQDQENYSHTQNMINQENQSLETLQSERDQFALDTGPYLTQLEDEASLLRDEINNWAYPDVSTLTNKVGEAYASWQRLAQSVQNLHNEKERLKTQYKKVQQDTHCPVCGTELNSEHRDQELENIKSQLRPILLETQNVAPLAERAEQKYREINTKLQQEQEKTKTVNQEVNGRRQDLQKYEKEINDLYKKAQDYDNNIKYHTGVLERLSNVPKPAPRDDERQTYQDKIQALKTEILDDERELLKVKDAVKMFSNTGIKSHVLDLVTPFLNKQANKYIAMLSGSNIEIMFSTQTQNKSGEMTDKFDVQVKNHTGGATYQANSEGEKKRIDLAVSLAIQDLVMSKAEMTTNFVVYDEVFDALDSVGSENVITLLKERLSSVESIFVITHSEHLAPLFEQTLTVKKDRNGLSKVIEGGAKT